MTEIGYNRYGKFNVELLRVVRDTPRHEVHQFRCQMMLEGEALLSSFESADNSQLVPTDTQKNTLFALAKKYPVDPQEYWAISVGKDLLSRHKQIDGVYVRVDRQPWERLVIQGKEHNHAFRRGNDGIRFTNMRLHRKKGLELSCGFSSLEVLKSTQSGFDNFNRDEYTTLLDTQERVLSTKVFCEYYFPQTLPNYVDFNGIYIGIQTIILELFAGDPVKGVYSASVQATMYQMATKILNTFPVLEKITFKLPNVHYYDVDFSHFKTKDLVNKDEVFQTYDGPHGQIEVTVTPLRSNL